MLAFLSRWVHLWKTVLVLVLVLAFLAWHTPTQTSGGENTSMWVIGGVVGGILGLILAVFAIRLLWVASRAGAARYLMSTIAAVVVVALGWVGYHFAPAEWGLSAYRAQLAVGVTGLAVMLGFSLSPLSWKKRGVWGGLALLVGALVWWGWQSWSGPGLMPQGKDETIALLRKHDLTWIWPWFMVPIMGLWSYFFSADWVSGYRDMSQAFKTMFATFVGVAMWQWEDVFIALFHALGINFDALPSVLSEGLVPTGAAIAVIALIAWMLYDGKRILRAVILWDISFIVWIFLQA